jgi:hypothetical protein
LPACAAAGFDPALIQEEVGVPDTQRFLSRIQSHFKAKYGGRFVGAILEEMLIEEPKLAEYLFPNFGLAKKLQTQTCEILVDCYNFESGSRKRRADLALVSTDKTEIKALALLEIKYEDHRNPDNKAQFADYVAASTQQCCGFTILTQYLLPISPPNTRVVLFSDFARHIRANHALYQNPVSRMFVEYVEDRNLMFKKPPEDHLRMLMAKLFNPWGKNGVIGTRTNVTVNIPDAFKDVLNNAAAVLQHVAPKIAAKNGRQSTNFYLSPWVVLDGKVTGKDRELDDSEKNGGILWTYGSYPLLKDKRGQWLLSVQAGLFYQIEKGGGKVKRGTYAELLGQTVSKVEGPDALYSEIYVSDNKYREADMAVAVRKAVLAVLLMADKARPKINTHGLAAMHDVRGRLTQ